MKHTLQITMILVLIFFISQLTGLVTINKYIQIDIIDGKPVVSHPDTVLGPPPDIEDKSLTFIPIVLTILVGTAFIFVLMYFRLGNIWKYWFLFAVIVTMSVSFGVYINPFIAFIIALILGLIKVFKPNVFVHNFTEIFIYTGITIVILPFLNLFSAFMLLIAISIYDAIAVWKSKHMIKLAEFQTTTKVFAGLLIPYKKEKGIIKEGVKVKTAAKPAAKKAKPGLVAEDDLALIKKKIEGDGQKNAILGGGDIAFPMLFSAAVMQHLIEMENYTRIAALNNSLIIALTSTIALIGLLLFSKENRFYPAMPFITVGCLIGYGIILLIA